VLECRATREVVLDGRDNVVTFAEVTGIHIDDACLVDGMLDLRRYRPAARLGYHDYAILRDIVTLRRPDDR
jgi:flavin reductase (DIM6/NTAB) family NADH-FMN oxidoreductase RutF